MTFTEAALEVLRSAGEPLHYKKITELAIEKNLLSHVGKTPEVTMSSRLAMMVKKDRGQAPIIKVKPGVFAIRESALEGQGLSAEALAAINEVESGEESGATIELIATEEVKTIAPALPGGDVFPEEEGDDDPILAGLEQESESGERGGRRRRRRRRRGKGDKVEGATEAPVRAEAPREPVREIAPNRQSNRESNREPNRESSRDRDRDQRRDSGRDRSRDNFREADRDAGREQHRDEAALDWNRQPADGDLLGRDLADAIWMVLSRGDRAPHSFARLAELLVRR
ncbi:MAG TPA: winged helix-turn-helix domain-containing protein, partial [Polyangiales bacterium]